MMLIAVDESADVAAVKESIKDAVAQFPNVTVESLAEYKETLDDQLDQIVYLLYALLAMSIVISLFGIANSLFLSIHERTGELGVLRAIERLGPGAPRDPLRERDHRGDRGLLAAVGIVFGWLVIESLSEFGFSLAIPVGQLVVFMLLAVVVGVGAIAPARRAARIDVLEAVSASERVTDQPDESSPGSTGAHHAGRCGSPACLPWLWTSHSRWPSQWRMSRCPSRGRLRRRFRAALRPAVRGSRPRHRRRRLRASRAARALAGQGADRAGRGGAGRDHRGRLGGELRGRAAEPSRVEPAAVAIAPRGYGCGDADALDAIGVAYDGTPEAKRALAMGERLARRSGPRCG